MTQLDFQDNLTFECLGSIKIHSTQATFKIRFIITKRVVSFSEDIGMQKESDKITHFGRDYIWIVMIDCFLKNVEIQVRKRTQSGTGGLT